MKLLENLKLLMSHYISIERCCSRTIPCLGLHPQDSWSLEGLLWITLACPEPLLHFPMSRADHAVLAPQEREEGPDPAHMLVPKAWQTSMPPQ